MSEKLFPRKVLRYTALKLQIFCNMGINIIGMYDVQVRYRNTINKLNVYILNIDRKPLLNRG